MTDPEAALGALAQQALAEEFGAEYASADPLIRPSAFADFQSNVAMSLSKRLGRAPRDVATPVAARLAAAPAVAMAEVSGPGFINITLSDEWIAEQSSAQLTDPRLGVERAAPTQRVVVDYSAPNVAKEMHVGICGPPSSETLSYASLSICGTRSSGKPRRRLGHTVRPPARASARRWRAGRLRPARCR